MSAPGNSMGRKVGEKAIKTTIAVVGLLVLRLILSALPMLKHSIVYMPSLSAQAGAMQQWLTPAQTQALQQEFQSLTPAQNSALQQAFGGTQPDQVEAIRSGFEHLFSTSAAVADLWAKEMMEAHRAIFPITIAKALVDTLIFLVLLVFGRDVGALVRSGSVRVPEMGSILCLAVIAAVIALAYGSYQGILFPFLMPDHADLYGWVFLAAGLVPLVAIVVLFARNMDAITAAVMHAGSGGVVVAGMHADPAAGPATCPSCRRQVPAGAKFCPHCATPLGGAGKRFCGSCGAENSPTAKFCGGCGQALAD